MYRKEKQRVQREGRTAPPRGDGEWKREREVEAGSVRMGLFVVEDSSTAGGDRGAADHLHPPVATDTVVIH